MTDLPIVDPLAEPAVTEDRLLDGRILLRQPKHGYRAAIDPVFLAAAVSAKAGENVVDLGTGVGAAALCLAARVPGARVAGVEVDDTLVSLARRNVERNGVADRVTICHGNIRDAIPGIEPASFNYVMANPPHLSAGTATPSPVTLKARANIEGDADLGAWIDRALILARPKATVTLVHRADRLDAILAAFAGRAGEIVVFPLWPGVGKDAKRVIVRARKGVSAPMRLLSGLVLHEADGRYTEAAQSVLRLGRPLPLGTP